MPRLYQDQDEHEECYDPKDPITRDEVLWMIREIRSGDMTSDEFTRRIGTNRIILEFPPSRNHTHVTTRQGTRVPKKEYKEYMKAARATVKAAVVEVQDSLDELIFHLFWPNLRRSDADNRLKICRDALVGTLVKDDCWTCIRQETIINELDRDNPRIEIMWI